MSHPVFSGAASDLIASQALSGSIVGFYAQSVGTITEVDIDHSAEAEFILSDVRIVEAVGARFLIEASRTTTGNVGLVVERIAGEGSGDLAINGDRVGLLV